MPAAKNARRKPRPRPDDSIPYAPSFASIASIVAVVAGYDAVEDVWRSLLVMFNKPIGMLTMDGAHFTVYEDDGTALDQGLWIEGGYIGMPENTPPSCFNISYKAVGGTPGYFIYHPPGKTIGDTDASGVPIGIKIPVSQLLAVPLDGYEL